MALVGGNFDKRRWWWFSDGGFVATVVVVMVVFVATAVVLGNFILKFDGRVLHCRHEHRVAQGSLCLRRLP